MTNANGLHAEQEGCRVFVLTRYLLPLDKPDGDCFVCGRELADHPKQTASLVAADRVFVIDESPLDV